MNGGNCWAFGGGWKTQFFWVGHFEKRFCKKWKTFFASFPWKSVKVYWLVRMGKILIKPNITTLFDPCQTFWCRASVWKCKLLSKKSNPPTVPICSIGPYKPTQLNANQKRRRSFAKAKSFFQSNCLTRDVTRAPHIRQKRWSCSTRLKVR